MAQLQISLFDNGIKDILKQASAAFNEMTEDVFNLRSLYSIRG